MKIKPSMIRLDFCSRCQLRCIECGQATGKWWVNGLKPRSLQTDNLTKLIETNPQIKLIETGNQGEAILNPNFAELLMICKSHNVETQLKTGVNFNYVSDATLEAIVDCGMKELSFSIDGASQATYKQYRIGGNFDQVVENIRRLNAVKKSRGSKRPALRWQFVVFGHNEHEIEKAREMAKTLGMNFFPKMNCKPDVSPVRDRLRVTKSTGWGDVVDREEYKRATKRHYMGTACLQCFSRPQITPDGQLLACCKNMCSPVGSMNVFRDGLQQTINSHEAESMRRAVMGENIGETPRACARCSIWQWMKESGLWVTKKDVCDDAEKNHARIEW